jgi:hypothetical protein
VDAASVWVDPPAGASLVRHAQDGATASRA